MRVHVLALCGLIVVLALTRPPPVWWALLLAAAFLVLLTELINTAIEALCDRVELGNDPLIERAKDCAAGAVLMAAGTAVVVAAAFVVHLATT